jgi:hypothetical protein
MSGGYYSPSYGGGTSTPETTPQKDDNQGFVQVPGDGDQP